MSTNNNPVYQHLVSHIADLEPRYGWTANDLPELNHEDVQAVCAAKPQSVMDNLNVEVLVLDAATGKNPAVRLPALLERAAREALFHDVEVECERRDEERQRRRDQAIYNRRAGFRVNA